MHRLNLISVKEELLSRKISIFSVRDFERIFKVLPETARKFLSFHSKRSSFKRLKEGVYIISSNPPTKFEIANYLRRPSYISFETALSLYGIIPETVYTVMSATPKPFKEFEFQKQNYRYHKIKKELFFGYRPVKTRNGTILIADREKAILDYIYLLSLKKKSLNDRMNLSKIDKGKLGRYVGYFESKIRKSKVFINLVKELNI